MFILGLAGAVWGFVGLSLVVVFAIIRLSPVAVEALSYELLWYHWLALIVNVVFMAYSEGYRGFQKGFSPRVVARCKYLKSHPKILHVLLAPLFAAGYFFSTKKRIMHIFILTISIIVFIQIIHQLGQPWRGVIDMGVVVGLTWGVISLCYFAIQAMISKKNDYSPELPDHVE